LPDDILSSGVEEAISTLQGKTERVNLASCLLDAVVLAGTCPQTLGPQRSSKMKKLALR